MSAVEVFPSYHDLWQVEQPLRMSKSDLQSIPMFHRQRDAIGSLPNLPLCLLISQIKRLRETGASTPRFDGYHLRVEPVVLKETLSGAGR